MSAAVDAGPVRILLIADSPALVHRAREALAAADPAFRVEQAPGMDGARRLAEGAFDAVLLDLGPRGGPGLAAWAGVAAAAGDAPVVVLADAEDEALAREAVRGGAADYVLSDAALGILLPRAVRYALERAAVARALWESEERWRLVARATDDSLWEYDAATETIWWGENALRSMGYAEGEAPATLEAWMRVVHPDDRGAFRESFCHAIDSGAEAWALEYRAQRRDGTYASVFERGSIHPRADGGRPRMVGALMDLTHQRRTEAALRESEARHRRLFETMAQGVLVWDRAGRLIDANPAAAALLGLSPGELLGRPAAGDEWEVVREDGSPLPPDQRPSLVAMRTGRQVDGVMGVTHAVEGRRRWLLVHARPQFHPGEAAPYQVFSTYTDITSLREARDARSASEERVRLITDTVREVFYLIETDPLRMRYLSPAFEAVWGIPRNAMYDVRGALDAGAAARFIDTIHPDDRGAVRGQIRRRIAGEELYAEYRIVRGDGQVRWLGDRSYPLPGPDGRVERIVGSIADITERRRAEEKVRRSEEWLSRILETVAEAVTIVDARGNLTYANPAAERVLGISRAEIEARSFNAPVWRITGVDGSPFAGDQLPAARVLATGHPVFGVEHAVEWPDGRRVVLSVNAAPLRDAAGRLEGVVCTMRDVTAAREAAERVGFQATLLNAAGEGVSAYDLEGRVTYWNRQAERCSGWRAAEAMGRPLSEVLGAHETGGGILQVFRDARSGGSPQRELVMVRRDGTTFPALVSAAPIHDPAGGVAGVVMACTDLTEVKRLEQQLHQAQRMEAIGRLAGGIAHDFNNILTGIAGYAHFLIEELDAGNPLRADAEEIRKAGDRAAALTRQLLAFSRKQALQPRVLDLGAVVCGMENLLRRMIGEDVELVFHCTPGVGQVMADPGQMEQVVLNLVVNARDAMPDGGRLVVELAARGGEAGSPPSLVLRVSDTGAGIPAAVLPHIFEPFFTTKPQGQGTGLGLSTVYGIVAQSGGTVDVQSREGAGSVFEVSLPRVDRPAEARAPAQDAPGAAQGETILLAEDDDAVRALACRTLRGLGYTVLEACSGAEALRLCERHPGPIDLLVTDVVMPEMSGPETADRISLLRPGLRVLYVSGYNDQIVARHGLVDAGRPLLEKPFTPAAFAACVRELLDGPPPADGQRALAMEHGS